MVSLLRMASLSLGAVWSFAGVRVMKEKSPDADKENIGVTRLRHGLLPGFGIFTPKATPGFGVYEGISLAIYSLLLALCIPYHESWFDEAQAWMIARDSTLFDLFVHRLHYEGSPGLWHFLLWVAIRLGIPFLGMHVMAGCVAVLGAFVWLQYCPLPRVISLLMPFTFFLQYEYAVVARSYVLTPLFAYLLLALYQNRESSPMLFCIVSGLFANCSLHMAAFSAGLAIIYASDRLRGKPSPLLAARKLLAPATVLVLFFVASAATAVPTADGSSTAANPVVETIRKSVSSQAVLPQRENRGELVSVTAEAVPPKQNPIAQAVWRAMSQGSSGNASPAHHFVIDGRTIRHLLVVLTAATASVSTSNVLAIGFLCLLAVNLAQAHLWITLLPWLLIQCCNLLVVGEAHHFGLLWIALTCAIWGLSLEPVQSTRHLILRTALYVYLLVLVILQIGWSVHALRGDVMSAYSGSQQTSAFLASLPPHVRIAAFDDDSITVNAYLPRSPYFNQHVDYWPFSRTKDPSLFLAQVIAEKPDVVSLKMSSPDQPVMYQWVKMTNPGAIFVDPVLLKLLLADHYHETHRFCGHRYFRDSSESTDCRLIFEPISKSQIVQQ